MGGLRGQQYPGGWNEGVLEAVRGGLEDTLNVEENPGTEEIKAVYLALLLQTVLWASRCTPRTATGYSPAMLAFEKELRMQLDMGNDRLEDMRKAGLEEDRGMASRRIK